MGCTWIEQPNSATKNHAHMNSRPYPVQSGLAGCIAVASLATAGRLNNRWPQVESNYNTDTFDVLQVIGATLCMGLAALAHGCDPMN